MCDALIGIRLTTWDVENVQIDILRLILAYSLQLTFQLEIILIFFNARLSRVIFILLLNSVRRIFS